MGLTPDPTGSGFVLPRAGVVKRQADGWTVVAMSQRERFIWAIPMELTSSEEADFIRIPGIGPVLATRLADFISRRVWLASVSELDEVPGVGSAKLRVLSEYLEVE
jgi:predicted DNA-binding helix-hairpin-helix protein